MKERLSFDRFILSVVLLLCAGNLAWAQEVSHVRIVRLSFAEGTVNLTRPNLVGSTEASVNTPIQEGYALTTAQDSFAEVEFENTSTARVGQFSELDFNQLALDSSGNKLNGMELRQGYATFTILPENGDVYQVQAGPLTIVPASEKGLQYRVDLDSANVRVEVFKGTVDVSGSLGQQRLGKNEVLEFDPGADEPLKVSRGITKDAWDEWVDQREDEAQLARRKGPPGAYTNDVNSYLYGWNDLYYYGSWNYIPGYGSCWFPAVGAGWVPFSVGQWVWYPGFGYTWVSFEPWGWLPFHYGGWFFDPGFGWAWVPGGFNAWAPAPVNWYQGQTWVAWSPRPLRPRPGGGVTPSQACPGQSCTTVVSTEAFRSGRPVQGHRVPGVDVTASSAVGSPTIAPIETVAVGGGRTPAGGFARPGGTPSGANPRTFEGTGEATGGRIVFDSKEGRFVNGRDSAPAGPSTSGANAPAATGVVAPRGAAPAEAHPARPAAPPREPGPSVSPGSEVAHHASPRTGIESPRSQDSFGRMVGSFGGGSSSGRSSSSSSSPSRSSSGGWSAPSSGGARSSGGFGGGGGHSSSGGGGGGGGGRSGGSSGGHSGGGSPHR